MTATQTTAEGYEIIATAMAGTSEIFITRQKNYGGTCNRYPMCYAVRITHIPGDYHYITWDTCNTETEARKSANRAWARYR